MNKILLLVLALSFSATSFGHPILFKCDNKGHLSELESSEDLFKAAKDFNTLSPDEIETISNEYCQGSEECLARLKQAGILSKYSGEVVLKLFKDELAAYDTLAPATEIPASSTDLLKKLKYLKELMACRSAQKKITNPSETFVQLYYPFNSNYMFATGCTKLTKDECTNYRKEDVKEVVKRSLFAGVDPYLFLALALQEQGMTQGPTGLYLDPIGIVKTMGCEGKSTKESKNAFDSFGTYYQVAPGVKSRKDITEFFNKYLEGSKTPKQISYLCNSLKDSDEIAVKERPSSHSCCLEIPYKVEADVAKNLLVPFYIKDMVAKEIPQKSKDPAFTVQLYNGFTNLMGGAEGVATFRTGLNFFKDPSYGYQGMDFIINSLLTNKELKDLIDEQKQKLGLSSPSILCKGKSEGAFSIDSDYYFNKHKNSKRLGLIYDKFKAGKGFSDLTKREQKVFLAEINSPSVLEKLGLKDYYSDEAAMKLRKNISEIKGYVDDELHERAAKTFEEFKDSMKAFHLDQQTLTVLYDYALLESGGSSDAPSKVMTTPVGDEIATKFFKDRFSKNATIKSLLEPSVKEINQFLKELNLDPSKVDPGELKEEWGKIFNSIKIFGYGEMVNSKIEIFKKFETNPGVLSVAVDATYPRKTVEEIVSTKSVPEDKKKILEEKIRSYFSQLDAGLENKVVDSQKYFKRYFQEVYKDRATVEKASDFPWRRFTDEEMEILSSKNRN